MREPSDPTRAVLQVNRLTCQLLTPLEPRTQDGELLVYLRVGVERILGDSPRPRASLTTLHCLSPSPKWKRSGTDLGEDNQHIVPLNGNIVVRHCRRLAGDSMELGPVA